MRLGEKAEREEERENIEQNEQKQATVTRKGIISLTANFVDKHIRRRFPAYGKTCSNCKKSNQFARVCQSKTINEIEEGSESDSSTDVTIFSVSKETENDVWHVTLDINGHHVQFKIDTAAQANTISKRPARKINTPSAHQISQKAPRIWW